MKKAPRPAEAGRGAMVPFMIERRCCVYWFRGASKFAVVHGFKHEAESVFFVCCIDALKPCRFQHGLDLHGAAFHLLSDCDRSGHQCLECIRGGDESLRGEHQVVECFLWKDEGLHQKAVSSDHLQALCVGLNEGQVGGVAVVPKVSLGSTTGRATLDGLLYSVGLLTSGAVSLCWKHGLTEPLNEAVNIHG